MKEADAQAAAARLVASARLTLETPGALKDLTKLVADAILAAWKQGAEEMRERAAERTEAYLKRDDPWIHPAARNAATVIRDAIRALKVPE